MQLNSQEHRGLIKGYWVPYGYIGYVYGEPVLFATEQDYYEYMEKDSNDTREPTETAGRTGWQ